MNTNSPANNQRYLPLVQLILARLREFLREPEAIFWVYGFPLVMAGVLGIAFRNKPVENLAVDFVASPEAEKVAEELRKMPRFTVKVDDETVGRRRLRTAKSDVLVIATRKSEPDETEFTYLFDPNRPDSVLARNAADDAIQRASGRKDVATISDLPFDEPGGRYIDFLIPGLLGANLMGGGLWGVGFVIVDMRIRKVLKRFVATPMKRSHFLMAVLVSRLVFMIPEVFLLLLFARIAFGVRIFGSLPSVALLVLVGSIAFAGIGLLTASRAKTMETISGLMNLIMIPMWMLSGIFFPSSRFPDAVQPVINLLPLTQLNNSLRAVMLDGLSITTQWLNIVALLVWGLLTFALALRWFRWM